MTGNAANSPTPQEIDDAQARVAPEDELWNELVTEMNRYGNIVETTPGGMKFTQHGETAARTYLITPHRLRDALVVDTAIQNRASPNPVNVERLPAWFLDDLRETIGEAEEPYSEPYVLLLERGDLVPSTSPTRIQRAHATATDERFPSGVWSDTDAE